MIHLALAPKGLLIRYVNGRACIKRLTNRGINSIDIARTLADSFHVGVEPGLWLSVVAFVNAAPFVTKVNVK